MVVGNVCVVSSLTRHSITKKHGAQLLCNETYVSTSGMAQ